MKISVCIDAVYSGKNFIESMKDIKASGINTIEFWGWWDKDIDSIIKACKEFDMEVSAFCTRFVSLVDNTKHNAYIEGLKETIEVACKLNCKRIITQVGDEIVGMSRERQHSNLVKGLTRCVPFLEEAGITLVFEPLNLYVNHKGYYLFSSDEAYDIVEEVGSGYVNVLYDVYHQQIMEGHLISRITKGIKHIGHFHTAGTPGRHELTNGEINYKKVFEAIDNLGYDGYIGFEYFPIEEPSKELRYWVDFYK